MYEFFDHFYFSKLVYFQKNVLETMKEVSKKAHIHSSNNNVSEKQIAFEFKKVAMRFN